MSSATLERTLMQPPPQLPPAAQAQRFRQSFGCGCATTSFSSSRRSRSSSCSCRSPSSCFSRSTNPSVASTTPGRSSVPDAWVDVWQDPEIIDPVILSLAIGFIAALVATILGTLIAFAIGRHRFKGRGATNLLIFMPMATPEVVMGASLLALFINMGLDGSLGVLTITIAHIMFCISFVVVTVKARIAGLDSRLEQVSHGSVCRRADHLPQGDVSSRACQESWPARLLAFSLVVRRLHHHQLHRREHHHFPRLCLGCGR